MNNASDDAGLMEQQRHTEPPPLRHAATVRHVALSDSPWLRTLSATQAAWADTVAVDPSLRRIDAARWPEARRWPSLCIDLAGCAMTLRLAPHAQWAELGEASCAGLADELHHAIAAHLTQGLREGLGNAAHRVGLIGENTGVGLHEGAWPGADTDDNAALLLALRMQPPGDAAIPANRAPWVAWLRVPAQVAPPARPREPVDGPRFDPALPVHLVLAEAQRVSLGALAGLLPGSVVLLDRIGADAPDLQARLVLGKGAVARFRFKDWQACSLGEAPTIGLTSPPATFMHWDGAADPIEPSWSLSMSDVSVPANQTLATALSEATTSVEAVIEMPPLRLSELPTWTPGTVLRTQTDIAGAHVLLRVAGKAVGRGRLVAIDSLLGLELVELFD